MGAQIQPAYKRPQEISVFSASFCMQKMLYSYYMKLSNKQALASLSLLLGALGGEFGNLGLILQLLDLFPNGRAKNPYFALRVSHF